MTGPFLNYLKEMHTRFNPDNVVAPNAFAKSAERGEFVKEPYGKQGQPIKYPLPLTDKAIGNIAEFIKTNTNPNPFTEEDIYKLVSMIFGCRDLSPALIEELASTIFAEFNSEIEDESIKKAIKNAIRKTIQSIIGENNGVKHDKLEAKCATLQSKRDALKAECDAFKAERDALKAECSTLKAETVEPGSKSAPHKTKAKAKVKPVLLEPESTTLEAEYAEPESKSAPRKTKAKPVPLEPKSAPRKKAKSVVLKHALFCGKSVIVETICNKRKTPASEANTASNDQIKGKKLKILANVATKSREAEHQAKQLADDLADHQTDLQFVVTTHDDNAFDPDNTCGVNTIWL